MSDLIRKGHVISIFVYFLFSLLVIALSIRNIGEGLNVSIGSIVFTILSFLILSLVLIKKRQDGIYEVIFFTVFLIMGFDVMYYLENIYILLIVFMFEWIICIAGMRKGYVWYVTIIQVASVCAYTFFPKGVIEIDGFSKSAGVVSALLIILAGYCCNKVIESFRIVFEDVNDELKSMDDLYRISSADVKDKERRDA